MAAKLSWLQCSASGRGSEAVRAGLMSRANGRVQLQYWYCTVQEKSDCGRDTFFIFLSFSVWESSAGGGSCLHKGAALTAVAVYSAVQSSPVHSRPVLYSTSPEELW
ncbi:hypothetical protein BCV70DRAFT_38153 [Testicularia cyperi]|uniref:Uncharacterized protein n=1 Tax=Testicularia cyperi TaxID=1882483 RepID=A0A317XJV7_9BASI|nr:hypothetical protein BCV70DRAFT_38153 [Testicularia cyperi]